MGVGASIQKGCLEKQIKQCMRTTGMQDIFEGTPQPIVEEKYQGQLVKQEGGKWQWKDKPRDLTSVTILIHGTWAPRAALNGWADPDNPNNAVIRSQLCKPLMAFIWRGDDKPKDREDASLALSQLIMSLNAQNIKVHLIGHSHGGNVARNAVAKLEGKVSIGQLVTLATPVLSDDTVEIKKIEDRTDFHMHVFSEDDKVVTLARAQSAAQRLLHAALRPLRRQAKIVPKSSESCHRKYPSADLQVRFKTKVAGPVQAHSDAYDCKVLELIFERVRGQDYGALLHDKTLCLEVDIDLRAPFASDLDLYEDD